MEAYKKHFPKRNRIVSGISDLVLVIEAEYRSGTSITAGYANEQKKIVCCLPSNIDSKCSIGTNRLIQQGARLIIKPNEIIEIIENKESSLYRKYNIDSKIEVDKYTHLNYKKTNKTKEIQKPQKEKAKNSEHRILEKEKLKIKKIEMNKSETKKSEEEIEKEKSREERAIKREKIETKENKKEMEPKEELEIKIEIPKEYEEIYKAITVIPVHINDICKISKKNIKEVTTTLTMLELEGHIEQIQGNCFKIKEKQCI